MNAQQWRTFGLFSMLTLGIAWFVDERIAVGMVGVAAFIIVIRNPNLLPHTEISGGGGEAKRN